MELETGETIPARCVMSSADPATTYLGLVGPEHLDTGFVRRVGNIRCQGLAAKLNLALDGLPTFTGVEAEHLGGRLVIGSPRNKPYVARSAEWGRPARR